MRRALFGVSGHRADEQEVIQRKSRRGERGIDDGNRPAIQQSKNGRVSRRLIPMLPSPQLLVLLMAAAVSPGPCSGFVTVLDAAGPVPYQTACKGAPTSSSRQRMQQQRPERYSSSGLDRLHLALPWRTAGRRTFQQAAAVDAGGDTPPLPPPTPPPGRQQPRQSSSPISIESIAATLESGQRQTSSGSTCSSVGNTPDPQQRQRRQRRQDQGGLAREAGERGGVRPLGGDVSQSDDGRSGFGGGAGAEARDGPAAIIGAGIAAGGGTGGGKRSQRNPNKLSIRKRRARKLMEQSPEQKQLQNEVALALKADSAADTLRTFNTAMDMGVPLRANLLSGVLNQCAKAGLMNDCMRVVMEMKERGMVIEENTFVPIIRGMVSRGNYRGAFDQIKSMVNQGVQPRLRCYEPIIAGACRGGDMVAAGEAWEHMEQQGVVPREEQFVNYLCGLSVAGQLWETARSGTLDDKLLKMSYHARNLTMEQAEQLEEHFNAIPLSEPYPETALFGGDTDSDAASAPADDVLAIAEAARSSPPLARRVKVAGGHEIDDDSWVREWSSREPLTLTASVAARKEEDGGAAGSSCPGCGGGLRAVGLTDGERARIRETLFGLAGLQVKKHARSRHTKLLKRKRSKERQQQQQDGGGSGGDANDDGDENSPFFSFTDEDQKEQLQIFVDWLHAQRAGGKTYTAVIDSANVAYHKGNAFHFSLPQVDLMVHALEAKGERPLVVIAEKYIDRVGDLYDNTMPTRGSFRYMSNPLNKAIVKRWRAKSQLYECSDEASDDWYWMFAAVAFDDIPMTVISNDRTRDHRMSLAETVPYLRWRTTQLAQFELTYALGPSMGKGSNSAGWPKNPPQVAIQPPPAFTRDVQKSEEGCWHVPAGADDEWLCIDVQRGLRMGLDRLTPPAGNKRLQQSAETRADEGHHDIASERGDARVSGDALAAEEEDKLSEVGGLLQSMRVKKQYARAFRYSTQGTVEEAAMAAKQAAARAKAEAAAADALTAEALFADAQTAGGVRPGSPHAEVLAADAQRVSARSAELRLTTGPSDGAGPREFSPRKPSAENGDGVRQQQRPRPAEGLRRRIKDSGATATAVASASTVRSVPTPPQGATRIPGNTPVGGHGASSPAAVGGRRAESRDRGTVPLNGERGGEAVVLVRKEGSPLASRELGDRAGGSDGSDRGSARELEAGVENVGRGDAEMEQRQKEEHWATMTVVALKDELRQRGLKVSGKKAELVERLVQG